MTTKELLNYGWELNTKINLLLERRELLLNNACNVTSGQCEERIQTSDNNSTECKILDYISIAEELDRKTNELYQHKQLIFEYANRVSDDTNRRIIVLRYIMFKKWEYIASFMDKPVNTVKGKIHAKAINELDKVINA